MHSSGPCKLLGFFNFMIPSVPDFFSFNHLQISVHRWEKKSFNDQCKKKAIICVLPCFHLTGPLQKRSQMEPLCFNKGNWFAFSHPFLFFFFNKYKHSVDFQWFMSTICKIICLLIWYSFVCMLRCMCAHTHNLLRMNITAFSAKIKKREAFFVVSFQLLPFGNGNEQKTRAGTYCCGIIKVGTIS